MTTLVRRSWCSIMAVCFALPLHAQDSTTRTLGGWSTAFTFGLPGFGREVLPAQAVIMGLHFTQLDAGKLSGDFAVGIMPIALTAGALAFGARAGLALPMQMSPTAYIVPSAGGSVAGVLGAGGGVVLSGGNVGLRLIFGGPSQGGVSMGLTWHKLSEAGGAIWLAEFGILGGKSRR